MQYHPSSQIEETPEVMPRQIINIKCEVPLLIHRMVVLPGERRIMTCAHDASIRVWDLESGAQIGEKWQEGYRRAVNTIALSPNGITLASGSEDGTICLWDIGTEKVTVKWTGHTHEVKSMCWSPDGERLVSGSSGSTARVWHGQSGEPILGPLETKHLGVNVVVYSPDGTKIATAGLGASSIFPLKIWDARTGELISSIEYDYMYNLVFDLAWTSDGKKLISGSLGGFIRILDTVTWQQIARIETEDRGNVCCVALFQNDRLLVCAHTQRKSVYLWNLDTNRTVGPPLLHHNSVTNLVLSVDGKLLIVGAGMKVYIWDIYAVLKEAGLEDLLSIPDKSFLDADATGSPAELEEEYRGRFFDDTPDGVHSSAQRYPPSSARHRHSPSGPFGSRLRDLFAHISSLPRRSQQNEATELQQRSRRSIFSSRGPSVVEVSTVRDRQALYVAPRPRVNDKVKRRHGQSQGQAQLSIPQTLPAVDSASTTPPDPAPTTAGAASAAVQSSAVVVINKPTWWARLVLFVCCASAQYTGSSH